MHRDISGQQHSVINCSSRLIVSLLLSDNKIKTTPMAQQFQITDDMLNLANRLDSQNFNVKSYRKRNAPNRNKKTARDHESVQLIGFHLQGRATDKSPEKTARTALSTRRFSSTAGARKRSQLDSTPHQFNLFSTARSKVKEAVADSPSDEENEGARMRWGEKHKGRFSQKEKELSIKGQLKNKHFEEWLNHALLESCRDEKFDRTIQHPALKKYGIDKNSLLSKGIDPSSLNRIFRALFVYSIGFNELLREVGGKTIRKALWKVFTILLEYCSDGDFETMIGQIERDKVAKMEMLRGEIERRQQVIDNNEDIHQQKNAKIFKELKQLREQNNNLENDKQVLMEDYKEAEQAFNEQVSLRLKFQNKINQIHGVHHELSLKHTKLYEDFQILRRENGKLKSKEEELTEILIRTKSMLQEEQTRNKKLKEEVSYCLQQSEMYKNMNGQLELKEVEWRHKTEELNAVIQQKERKIDQIARQLQNSEMMVSLGREAEKQLQKEYQRSLDENKQLVQSLQSQLQQLNKYMLQKKEFNDTHARLYAELSISNEALKDRKEEIEKSRALTRELRLTLDKKDVIVRSVETKNNQLHVDLADCYGKIQEMKRIKNAVEEEAGQLRRKEATFKAYFADKEKQIAEMADKLEDLERRVSEFNITKRSLDSRVALLTQKMTSDEEMFKKKVVRLEQELVVVEKERKSLRQQIEQRRTDSTKYLALYEQAMAKIKDHVFERNDLELRYNQSLNVVQNETGHIKNLSIRISQMEERNQEIARELKTSQFVMEGRQKTFRMELSALRNHIDHQKALLAEKKEYIHPMVHEDALAAAISESARLNDYKQTMEKRLKESKEHELEKQLSAAIAELGRCKSELQKEISLATRAYEDQKQRAEELEGRLREKENVKADQKAADSFKSKQIKYLEFLKEKSGQIEQLQQQVERMQDSNAQMVSNIQALQRELHNKSQRVEQLDIQKRQLELERRSVQEEKKALAKEKEEIASALEMRQTSKGADLCSVNSESRQQSRGASEQKSRLASREEQRGRRAERAEWRNDFTKKVRNAYKYYKK